MIACGRCSTVVSGYSRCWPWPDEGCAMVLLERGSSRRQRGGAVFPGEAPGPDAEQNLVFGATDCHLLFRLEWGNVSRDID